MLSAEDEMQLNRAARFLPMGSDDGLPSVEVGGVQVYVYFKGGQLCVSVHYDAAAPEVQTEEDTVPTRVNLGGEDVYTAS